MEMPKKMLLVNSTREEHLGMLKSVLDELPLGDCTMCGKKEVKVFEMTKTTDPAQHMNVCFECMTGEGCEVVDSGDPANN